MGRSSTVRLLLQEEVDFLQFFYNGESKAFPGLYIFKPGTVQLLLLFSITVLDPPRSLALLNSEIAVTPCRDITA